MEGDGFHDFAQHMIDIGAKYESISADLVLPCNSTVSRQEENVVAEEKKSAANTFEYISFWSNH